MGNKTNVNPTSRQLRRQQQREAEALASQATPTIPIESSAKSDTLGPSLLVPLFCATIVMGYLLYARGVATLQGNELSRHQSLFTAVNAGTLTGFQQARNPDQYTASGQVLTFALMISGILFSFICGGSAVIRIARLRFTDLQLLLASIGSVFLVAVGGGLALFNGSGEEHRTFFQCMFQAISAFGNCGLFLGPLPGAASIYSLLVLLPLAILGGLGLPVLMDLIDAVRSRRPLCIHTRTVLTWMSGSYIVITLVLLAIRWPGLNASASFWQSAFVTASIQSINARSTGFPFQFASALPQEIAFALVLVMLIGAAPAGTAGGLKVTTLAELFKGIRQVMTRQPAARSLGLALLWIGVYLLLWIASTVALLMSEPEIHLDRCVFLAASAAGNVGLSYNPIDVSTAGLYILSATMLLGRIAPVMMLWYMVDTTPEADVAIG